MVREDKKVKTIYIKKNEIEVISKRIAERQRMEKAVKTIRDNLRVIERVIK